MGGQTESPLPSFGALVVTLVSALSLKRLVVVRGLNEPKAERRSFQKNSNGRDTDDA